MRLIIALLLTALVPAGAAAQELMGLLAEGPVVMLKSGKDDRFESATGVIHIDAPADRVWDILVDVARYKEFMPKMVKSEVSNHEGQTFDVKFEIEVPGSNPRYVLRYQLDPPARAMKARWVKGDLKHTYESWRVVPHRDGGTLVYYTTSTKHFSALAQSLEDDQQTITLGVNVATALVGIRAVKRRAETRVEPAAE